MFRRGGEKPPSAEPPARVDSVMGEGLSWNGDVTGSGGLRIDGAFEGEIALRGLVVVGEQGRVACKHLRAVSVVVAGSVKGDITAQRVEITRSGRVWGDVVTTSFATEEGAFLRGQIRMEETIDLGLGPEPAPESPEEGAKGT
ncbi:MAG: polymer-forming cytoskeletal protein [Anaerolineales bacterium]